MTRFQAASNPTLSLSANRLQIQHLLVENPSLLEPKQDGADAILGLSQTPKTLPPRYFYDDRGSQLFEQICELPEYYVTRTETAILHQSASEIAEITGPCEIVELGSGSSTKTRILLNAYQDLYSRLSYVPIDVSGGMLEATAHKLLAEYPQLKISGLVATYEMALAQLPVSDFPTRMIAFIGSTLGNLTPSECEIFFHHVTRALNPGEYFLLGVDLQKPVEILHAAYNDQQGVTAAFNLNMLTHLNRRYQGNFNLSKFEHWAFYNESENQIEMHLRSLCDQQVHLKDLDLTVQLAEGETIWTEISRKFHLEQLKTDLAKQGLNPVQVWTDAQGWFGLILCRYSG